MKIFKFNEEKKINVINARLDDANYKDKCQVMQESTKKSLKYLIINIVLDLRKINNLF